MTDTRFEIFLTCPPGLESALSAELTENGFAKPRKETGGVSIQGGWIEVWRANLQIRGATRVLARIDSFRANHLNQLLAKARLTDWGAVLHRNHPVRIEASTRKSRLYHTGAIQERIGRAISETHGAPIRDDAQICIRVRIDHDICTLSLDTSGEPLHKRGYKQAVAKAPLRETLAALLLREAGFNGRSSLLDPMCGSGTLVIEAAELAAGLSPGRSRHFAFENLSNFNPEHFETLRNRTPHPRSEARCIGYDRDPGAVRMSMDNATRAAVSDRTHFSQHTLDSAPRPDCEPGLIMVNPPYGARIGDKKSVYGLYKVIGQSLRERFSGWRVGLITRDDAMARTTGLDFTTAKGPYDHGGIKIKLYQTDVLA